MKLILSENNFFNLNFIYNSRQSKWSYGRMIYSKKNHCRVCGHMASGLTSPRIRSNQTEIVCMFWFSSILLFHILSNTSYQGICPTRKSYQSTRSQIGKKKRLK